MWWTRNKREERKEDRPVLMVAYERKVEKKSETNAI
jgi:hypothetical protein